MRIIRLKHAAWLVAGGTPRIDDPAFWAAGATGIPWVTIGDMSGRDVVAGTSRSLTDEGLVAIGARPAPTGTILYSMYASVGLVARLGVPAVWNQAILGVIPRPGVSSGYLAYALRALQSRIGLFLRSNTQHNLNAEVVGNLALCLPPERVQRRIAGFLDVETARIDALISARTRQAASLIERRRAVMFAAVSGTLTSDGPRRSTATPWLSTLPERWGETKLTRVARLGSGHTPSRSRPDWWTECSIPWITTGEVAQIRDDRQEVLVETREMISEVGLANSAAELRPAGTVVLCRTAASAGYSALMGSEMATSQDFATWTCGDQLLPRFLLFCLRAMRPDLLGRLAMGSTHRTIYFPDIHSIRIPLPTIDEQRSALDAADRQLDVLGPLEGAIDRQIALLRERRQALIAAAVTGKLEVRESSVANTAA